MKSIGVLMLMAVGLLTSVVVVVMSGQAEKTMEPMQTDNTTDPNLAEAVFGAGCFWGVEHFFAAVPGVGQTAVGYMGGHTENPTYRQVCGGDTGHAEVVYLRYDPNEVDYASLVRLFFKMHDPTTRNRQGPDVGSQYRSVIFTYSGEQHRSALAVREQLNAAAERAKRPIVTEVAPATTFWRAEDYHQQYFKKTPGRSCHIQFCPTMLEE